MKPQACSKSRASQPPWREEEGGEEEGARGLDEEEERMQRSLAKTQ